MEEAMTTNSRYDFMTDGKVRDEITRSYYPDPLSLNYNKFNLSSIPVKDSLNSVKIKFLWKEAEAVYGKPCWDDMVLTLNGIPHKNFIKAGDSLYFPSESNIIGSFDKGRK